MFLTFNCRYKVIYTKLKELELILNYNIISLFSKKNPLKISIGCIYSFYSSNHDIQGSRSQDLSTLSKTESNGQIFYPNVIVSYDFGDIQLGLSSKLGFSNDDYLEGYHKGFTNNNDQIYVTSITLGYLIK